MNIINKWCIKLEHEIKHFSKFCSEESPFARWKPKLDGISNTHNFSGKMWTGLNRLRIGSNNRRLKEKRNFLHNHSTTKTYLLSSSQQKQSTKRDLRISWHDTPFPNNQSLITKRGAKLQRLTLYAVI